MTKLTVLGENRDLARKVQVDFVTQADPTPAALLFARSCVRHAEVSAAFSAGKVDRAQLGAALTRLFPEELAHLVEQAAEYLADEHEQIVSDGDTLLINPTSGRAMAKLRPEDFYVPAPVPREDGTMVKRSPQVKPEILALVTQHQHDVGRDEQIEQTMLSRAPSFLPEVSRRQTMFVTKSGRKQTAATIHDQLGGLIENSRGIAKALFDCFPKRAEPYEAPEGSDSYWQKEVEWTADLTVAVQDPTARNLKFDPVAGSTAAITTSWARLLGQELLQSDPPYNRPVVDPEKLPKEGLYLCGPETSKKVPGRTLVVSAQEGLVLHLTREAGQLYIRDYETQYREVHEKWVLRCTALGVLYVDWSRVQAYLIEGVDGGPPVELVG